MNDQNPLVNPATVEQSPGSLAVNKPLSRRTLLKIGGTIATAAVAAPILAACGDSPTATNAPASTTAPAAGATAAAQAAATKAGSSSGGTLLVYWNAGHNYKTYQGV